jgi:outer membrane protein assembly factor BamB
MTEEVQLAEPAKAISARTAARHKWFPAAVLMAAALFWAWLLFQSDHTDDYKNVFTAAAVMLSTIAVSVWFLRYGGGSRRRRRWIVGAPWLAFAGFLLLFRPVLNGDLGIVGWRPRFARAADETIKRVSADQQATDWQTTPQDYSRFLGNGFWAEVHGVRLETDWQKHPPQEIWRREIGAGWSAFAVAGNYAITQEQRGQNELVTCYRVDNGEPVWVHSDPVRFDPAGPNASFAGPGPRATPTIYDERVFTQGATGVVNCLDARTGKVLWSQDTVAEQGVDLPMWGKSNSPLVVDDMVVISVGAAEDGKSESSLVAYDIETGEIRWAAGTRAASYASPIVATLAGERQIISVNEKFVTAHRVSDGRVLWEHPWADENDASETASQPVPLDGDRLFVSKGYGVGATLVQIARAGDENFEIRPLWNPPIKPVMKTKMGNVVVRDGFVYGLDGVLLECIELATGNVEWKKRRRPSFGHGQLLLVGEVILVLTEGGELLAVEVSPQRYHELASVQVLDAANVTWNNPALAPPYLLVRNGREAACYLMPLK